MSGAAVTSGRVDASIAGQVQLAGRVRVAVGRLNRRLRLSPGGDGLTSTQLSALVSVEKHGPLRIGDLAAQERIAPPTMTRVVAGLVREGLIARRPDPTDGRAWQVALTSRGTRLLERGRARGTSFIATALAHCTPEQLAALDLALPVLESIAADDNCGRPPA